MKEKHYKVLAVLVIVLAVGMAGVDVFYTLGGAAMEPPDHSGISANQVVVPGEGKLRDMDRLNGRLADLATPPPGDLRDVNLGMFGYAGDQWRRHRSGETDLLPPGMDFSISFAFSSRDHAYCVIDGVFCREGTAIGGGARVLQIESSRVLVKKGDYEAWIPVGRVIQVQDRKSERAQE